MITIYTADDIRDLQKRIKSLEGALQDYVDLHQRMVDQKIINPALGAPIRATAKKLLTQ